MSIKMGLNAEGLLLWIFLCEVIQIDILHHWKPFQHSCSPGKGRDVTRKWQCKWTSPRKWQSNSRKRHYAEEWKYSRKNVHPITRHGFQSRLFPHNKKYTFDILGKYFFPQGILFHADNIWRTFLVVVYNTYLLFKIYL